MTNVKKQESMTHTPGKKKAIETKDFKVPIINMSMKLKKTMMGKGKYNNNAACCIK